MPIVVSIQFTRLLIFISCAMPAGCSMRWKAVFIEAANYNPIIIRFRWICHKIACRSCGNYANSITIPGELQSFPFVLFIIFRLTIDLIFDASIIKPLTPFTTGRNGCNTDVILQFFSIFNYLLAHSPRCIRYTFRHFDERQHRVSDIYS